MHSWVSCLTAWKPVSAASYRCLGFHTAGFPGSHDELEPPLLLHQAYNWSQACAIAQTWTPSSTRETSSVRVPHIGMLLVHRNSGLMYICSHDSRQSTHGSSFKLCSANHGPPGALRPVRQPIYCASGMYLRCADEASREQAVHSEYRLPCAMVPRVPSRRKEHENHPDTEDRSR